MRTSTARQHSVLALTFLLLSVAVAGCIQPESSEPIRRELRTIVENVAEADDMVFGAKDSAGQVMDTVKIIEDPAGGYLAVYHTAYRSGDSGKFRVSIATSDDLLNWTFQQELADQASQPYIHALDDGGFVVAWEQEPRNHLAFRYYPNRDALVSGTPTRSFDAPQTLSAQAEGTPNIYAVELSPDIDNSVIDVGAHYFHEGVRDLQQRGTLYDFNRWETQPQPDLDAEIMQYDIEGSIGDRDWVLFRDYPLGLIEGQGTFGKFETWRIFLYDYRTGKAEPLTITTPAGSSAFANPTITDLHGPDGRQTIVVTLFIPSEGAVNNEAGQLIYYRAYE